MKFDPKTIKFCVCIIGEEYYKKKVDELYDTFDKKGFGVLIPDYEHGYKADELMKLKVLLADYVVLVGEKRRIDQVTNELLQHAIRSKKPIYFVDDIGNLDKFFSP